MSEILDSKGEALLVGMHVRLSSGKPRHGKVTKLSPEAVDVQTERGLRTVRPSDVVGVKLHAGRTRARHAVRLKALMQGATQAPRSRKL